jgi:ribonuclease-3 family protein
MKAAIPIRYGNVLARIGQVGARAFNFVKFEDQDTGIQVAEHSSGMPSQPKLLSFLPDQSAVSVQRFSPAALAYLGDAVYELYVRAAYLVPPKRLQDYHTQVVSHVRAETQALHLEFLQPYLTETEQEILRRGRNAVTNKPRRVEPKIYQQATSLETLLGYLYITDPQRLFQLLNQIPLETLCLEPNVFDATPHQISYPQARPCSEQSDLTQTHLAEAREESE